MKDWFAMMIISSGHDSLQKLKKFSHSPIKVGSQYNFIEH